ncbi:MAG: pyridoxal-phosphate dependent enzyme, partial [Gemmatimonadales bacterium]
MRATPLEPSPTLSNAAGCRVYLKLENVQVTGSFKARGAFNKLLSLTDAERSTGIVTASTGNHALAVAHALGVLGVEGEIFLPSTVSPLKLEALRSRGAELRLVDADPGRVETIARARADASGRVFISPYNDPEVIGGQGTVAVELQRELDAMDTVLVPVGGGGLIAGIGGLLKARDPAIRVVGCQPVASPVLAASVAAGRIVEMPSGVSLSDATLGLLEPGAITFPICQSCVDEWLVVEEAELRAAVRLILEQHSLLVEGAAALPVAA